MPAEKSPIPGLKVMLMGMYDSGKTTAIKTLVRAGITPMCIFTEPNFQALQEIPTDKLHWVYHPAIKPDFAKFVESITPLKSQTPDQVQKGQDTNRMFSNPLDPILASMMKFVCARDGKDYGNVGSWGTDKCLVIDSLTGLTAAVEKYTVGEKYAMTQPEFQIAMKLILNLVNQCVMGFRCHFVLTAHIEREIDEVTGASFIYASTLGRKLAPKIPANFTDVIETKSDGLTWWWCTRDPQAVLKAKFAIRAEKITPPDFTPLVEAWKKAGGIVE